MMNLVDEHAFSEVQVLGNSAIGKDFIDKRKKVLLETRAGVFEKFVAYLVVTRGLS